MKLISLVIFTLGMFFIGAICENGSGKNFLLSIALFATALYFILLFILK